MTDQNPNSTQTQPIRNDYRTLQEKLDKLRPEIDELRLLLDFKAMERANTAYYLRPDL